MMKIERLEAENNRQKEMLTQLQQIISEKDDKINVLKFENLKLKQQILRKSFGEIDSQIKKQKNDHIIENPQQFN